MDSEFCNHYILILEHFHHSPKKLHTRFSPNPDSMLALGSHSSLFRFVYYDKHPEEEIWDTIAYCGQYYILNVIMNDAIICV